jgi:hypothetical protein
MSSKFNNLFTETEIGKERVIEVRIRDVKTNKSRNFSLLASKDEELPSLEELRDFFENSYKKAKKK